MVINFKKCISFFFVLFLSFQAPLNAYNAAGVLPYALDNQGNVCLLLGLSRVHGDQASDFGGFKDATDDGSSTTAAREGCEELLFVFDHDAEFKSLLQARQTSGAHCDLTRAQTYQLLVLQLNNNQTCFSTLYQNYRMHFIKIDFDQNLPGVFEKRKQQYQTNLPNCWNETTKLEWIKLDTLKKAIKQQGTNARAISIGTTVLYGPFVQSLLVARDNGIFDTLKKVCTKNS